MRLAAHQEALLKVLEGCQYYFHLATLCLPVIVAALLGLETRNSNKTLLKQLNDIKNLSNEKQQKQKIISYSTTGGLILVLLFAFFVFNRLRVTAKQKKIIEEQKNLVEVKQKEILDSITYAKRLQEAILPPDNFVKELLFWAVL